MKKLSFLFTSLIAVMLSSVVFAQTGTASIQDYFWACAIGAGLIMGVASGLGALGQSRAAAAALEGIARNPQAADKIQTPMILSLVLMESLVLFSFAIAFLLQNRIP